MGSVLGYATGGKSVKQVSCQSEQWAVSIPAAPDFKRIKIERENFGLLCCRFRIRGSADSDNNFEIGKW